MARRQTGDDKIKVGNITGVSGKVTIAGEDIYEGYTAEQVSLLMPKERRSWQKPGTGLAQECNRTCILGTLSSRSTQNEPAPAFLK
jgi:hypothetical protein